MSRGPKDALLGLDFGTGGCKVSLIDAEGTELDGGFEEYPSSRPQAGWTEQLPEDWLKAMLSILKAMKARGSFEKVSLAGISLDGSTHNAVLMDASMKPLRPVIMWTDLRSAAEAAELERLHGKEIFKTAWQRPAPTWTLPQMLWLKRNEPEVLERTERILFVKDFIRHWLTGDYSTDRIEAQGSLFYDMAKRSWSEELCEMGGVPFKALPPLREPKEIVGKVSKEAASASGLPEGVPVVCGCSDSAVEDYAAGAVEPGHCVVKIATAGNFNVMTDNPVPNERTLTYSHVVPGLWYTVTATNSAATCVRWFRDCFCQDLVAKAGPAGAYELMDAEAKSSPAGARGLLFHPYLQGERSPYWDSSLKASFTGATGSHSRGDFIRAVMEGVAFSLLDCKRSLDSLNLPLSQIRLIGGGAKSPLWSRVVCDVFGKELLRPVNPSASFGAAVLAGVGVGLFPDELSAVQSCVKLKDSLKPDEGSGAIYKELFGRYLQVHDSLAGLSKGLN